MDATLELLKQTQSLSPTCRRGEGFAAGVEVADGVITGQAVPFGKTVELGPDLFERFELGAFRRQLRDPARVKLCLEHGQVIGKCESLEETEDGLRFTARISTRDGIPEARRARDLLEDELVDELSIGFSAVNGGTDVQRRDDGTTLVTHRRARLLEISLVPFGVYGRDATLRSRLLEDHPVPELSARRAAQRRYAEEFAARVRSQRHVPPVAR